MTETPLAPWQLAEDAVVRGDAGALAALLREHGDALRRRGSMRTGGLPAGDPDEEARAIIAREHCFADWNAFAAHAQARRDPASTTARFEAAADAIVSGDLGTLTGLLRADPDLIRARSARTHRATLLHYLGSNGVEGFRQRAPANTVAIGEALLDAGADIDAEAEMYGGGDTTLGLAATSIHPVRAGVAEPLLTMLLARGASPSAGRRGRSGIINACLANGRPEAAEFLAPRVDGLDLEAAAGLGWLDIVQTFVNADGSINPPATLAQRNDGFSWACEYGRTSVVRFLLAHGMDVAARLRPHGQTGLHWAAFGAQVDTVEVLLGAGAPLDLRDDTFDGTPLDWVVHAWAGRGPGAGDSDYTAVAGRLVAAGATLDPGWLNERTPRTPTAEAVRQDPAMRAALGLDPG